MSRPFCRLRRCNRDSFVKLVLGLNAQLGRASDMGQVQLLFQAARRPDGQVELTDFLRLESTVQYFLADNPMAT